MVSIKRTFVQDELPAAIRKGLFPVSHTMPLHPSNQIKIVRIIVVVLCSHRFYFFHRSGQLLQVALHRLLRFKVFADDLADPVRALRAVRSLLGGSPVQLADPARVEVHRIDLDFVRAEHHIQRYQAVADQVGVFIRLCKPDVVQQVSAVPAERFHRSLESDTLQILFHPAGQNDCFLQFLIRGRNFFCTFRIQINEQPVVFLDILVIGCDGCRFKMIPLLSAVTGVRDRVQHDVHVLPPQIHFVKSADQCVGVPEIPAGNVILAALPYDPDFKQFAFLFDRMDRPPDDRLVDQPLVCLVHSITCPPRVSFFGFFIFFFTSLVMYPSVAPGSWESALPSVYPSVYPCSETELS